MIETCSFCLLRCGVCECGSCLPVLTLPQLLRAVGWARPGRSFHCCAEGLIVLSLHPVGSTLALLLNFFACLASFCVEASHGSDFGLSILWVVLFTPCSFVCWYRPMYKAFR